MRKEVHALTVPASATTGTGAEQNVADLIDKWVQVGGAFAGGASITLEGTLNGSQWVALAAPFTAVGTEVVEIPDSVQRVRVNRTVAGTGLPTVHVGGFNARTD